MERDGRPQRSARHPTCLALDDRPSRPTSRKSRRSTRLDELPISHANAAQALHDFAVIIAKRAMIRTT